jgi:hypothetical protein
VRKAWAGCAYWPGVRRRYDPKVADDGVGPMDPDVDHWAVRERLWQQLLAGELTEVAQVGGEGFLVWRFGLEPIDSAAYQYNAAGERTSSAECERIARELAAQRCWAVGCTGVFWTEHSMLTLWDYQGSLPRSERQTGVIPWDRCFIERAQIALIVLRTERAEAFQRSVRVLRRSRRKTNEPGFAAEVEDDRAQIKFYRRLREYSLYYSPKRRPRPPYSFVVAKYLLDKYPDKTLVVSSPYEIAQLRRLRIPREPRSDG